MKAKRRLAGILLLIVLLSNLSTGVLAAGDGGTTRPKDNTTQSTSGEQ